MVTQMFQLPSLQSCVSSLSSSAAAAGQRSYGVCSSPSPSPVVVCKFSGVSDDRWVRRSKNRRFGSLIAKQEKGDVTEIRIPVPLTLEQEEKEKENDDDDDVYEEGEADPEDLKYVNEIKRVCEFFGFSDLVELNCRCSWNQNYPEEFYVFVI